MRLHVRALASIALAFIAGSCADSALFHPDQVSSRDKAAAVLVSVSSVMPWSQVSDSLAPNFKMDGEQAVTEIAPTTARINSQVLNAFGAGLAAGLPQTSTQGTTTQTSALNTAANTVSGVTTNSNNNSTGNSSNVVTTTSPGVVPQLPSGTPTGAALPAANGIAGEIDIDPILKRRAALALFEEVQLLNREVQAAALQDCMVPYLVRLKIAVMPYKRHLPYDLHARISFFPGDATPPKTDPATTQRCPTDTTTSASPPKIIPLLVTDDVERAMTSRAVEVARQISFALNAMVQSVGASASANAVSQALNSISAQDINSVLTVARQSDNTLYVRIGASNEGTAGYALVGQTHDISLILLVPKEYFNRATKWSPSVQLVSFTQFRNATTGALLDDESLTDLQQKVDDTISDFVSQIGGEDALGAWNTRSPSEKEAVYAALRAYITYNDIAGFAKLVCSQQLLTGDYCKNPRWAAEASASLWTRLGTLKADSAYQSAALELRAPQDMQIEGQIIAENGAAAPKLSPATALDDGDNLQVYVDGVTGISNFATMVRLDFTKNKQSYSLYPSAFSLDPVSRVLSLTFPSPQKWKLPAGADATLHFIPRNCDAEEVCADSLRPDAKGGLPETVLSLNVLAASDKNAKKNAPTGFDFSSSVTEIVAGKDTGTGTVAIALSKLNGDTATISVDKAEIDAAVDEASKPLTLKGGKLTVSQDGGYVLKLRNIHKGQTVTITAATKKSGTAKLQFSVVYK